MAVEQFNADIDLLGHIIRNVKIHPMTNAERVSLASSLGANDVGRTIFDRDEQLLYVWTGTDFVVGNLIADWNDIVNKPATFPASPHTHTESEITDLDKYTQQEVDYKLNLKIDSSEKGSPAGVATLGVDGKVPSSQLPDSFSGDMTYKGAWNASTNTPTIANGTGENGDYYRVSVAGSTVIDGNSDWQVGDSLIFNATTGKWEKIDGSAPVNSVFGRTGIIQQENGDYNSSQITNSSLVEGDNVSEALNELHINKAETLHTHEISDVNGLQVELNKKLNNLVSYGGGVEVVKPKLIPDVTTQGARTLAGVNGITLNLVGDLIQIVGQGSALGLMNSDHGSILNVNGNTGQDISPSSNIKVTQFDTAGNSQQGIVPNSSLSRLTIGTTGVYLIGMSGSVMSSGTTKATIKLYVNSVEVPNFSTEIDIDTVNKRKAYAITLPLSLTVGDVLEMFVSHDSLDSRTLTFKKNTLFASKQDVESGSAVWGNISGSISNQVDLQSALSGKANTNHTHTESQITNLDKYSRSEIDGFLLGKSNVGHTHVDTSINNTSSVAGATVRDALNTLHDILGISWGEITGDITTQTDLQTALNTKLTNGTNLGGETPLVKGKNGLNLEVRTLKGIGGISISLNNDVVEIAGGSWGSITGNLVDQTDLQAVLGSKIPSSEKGIANGVATLDGSGKIPASQLSVSAMEYKGTWNASTNTPVLASGVGNNGDIYRVSTAGTTNLDGITDWQVGDWVIFNGNTGLWEKADNSDSVSSVFGRVGSVIAQSGDYNATQVTNDSGVTGASVKDALNNLNTGKSNVGHSHVEADITNLDKYTQSEVNTLLAGKSNVGHIHDDRYYTEDEINAQMADKVSLAQIDVSDPSWLEGEDRLLLTKKEDGAPSFQGAAQLIDIFAPPGVDTMLTDQSGWVNETKTLTGNNFFGALGQIGQVRVLEDGTICHCVGSVAGSELGTDGSATYRRNRAVDVLDPDNNAQDSDVCDLLNPARTGGTPDDGWNLTTGTKTLTVPARWGTWWKDPGGYMYFCYDVAGSVSQWWRNGTPPAIYRYINTSTHPILVGRLLAHDFDAAPYEDQSGDEISFHDQWFYDSSSRRSFYKATSTTWEEYRTAAHDHIAKLSGTVNMSTAAVSVETFTPESDMTAIVVLLAKKLSGPSGHAVGAIQGAPYVLACNKLNNYVYLSSFQGFSENGSAHGGVLLFASMSGGIITFELSDPYSPWLTSGDEWKYEISIRPMSIIS